VLGANFAEGTVEFNPLQTPRAVNQCTSGSVAQSERGEYTEDHLDSDDEDDAYFEVDEDDELTSQVDISDADFAHVNSPHDDEASQLAESFAEQDGRQVDCSASSHLNSSSTCMLPLVAVDETNVAKQIREQHASKPHLTVVIRGVAYNTYRALLYYVSSIPECFRIISDAIVQLYTDNIVFAPLSSSFTSSCLPTASPSLPSSPRLEGTPPPASSSKKGTYTDSATSRKEWIREWMKHNSGRPAPCSAKAIYREADRRFYSTSIEVPIKAVSGLGLNDLKARAAQVYTEVYSELPKS
jgi:hypothetical protein